MSDQFGDEDPRGSVRVERTLGVTHDGGSCSNCGGDYRGSPYTDRRGRRVLAEIEPGLVEPVNLCHGCWERETGGDL